MLFRVISLATMGVEAYKVEFESDIQQQLRVHRNGSYCRGNSLSDTR